MNKFVTILGISISIAPLGYSLNPTILTLVLCFIISLACTSIGFWLDKKLKVKNNSFLNKLYYHFSRKDSQYDFDTVESTYVCLENNEYKCRRIFVLKPRTNDLQAMESRYRWSASSKQAKIIPYDVKHKIKNLRQECDWNCYTIDFGKICTKGEKFTTGATIENLSDPNNEALPFFSHAVTRKTKLLKMTVEFPEGKQPKGDVTFSVMAYGRKIENNPVEEVLKYDPRIGGYSKTINYPRIGWTYIISWKND